MNSKHTRIFIAAGLVLMAAAARVVNAEMHLYNFAPVAALGLFCGAVVKDKRYAFLFALLGQFLGDVYFALFTQTQGFYGVSQLFTYAALVAVTVLGIFMRNIKALNVLVYTLGGSLLFFLVSNFGHFMEGWNGYTSGGLVKTYVDALPFYRNSIVGDLIGSTLLFGLYFLLQRGLAGRMQRTA